MHIAHCVCARVCVMDRLREPPFKAALKHRCVPKTKRPSLHVSLSHLPKSAEPLEVAVASPCFLVVSSQITNPLPFPSLVLVLGRGPGRSSGGRGRGGRNDIIRHKKGSGKGRHLPLYDSLSLPPVIRHVSLSGGSAPN